MSINLRWTIRVIAGLNIVLFAFDLLLPRYSPLALFFINLWALLLSAIWAVLTSLLLPIFALVEAGRLNDANSAEQRGPVIVDVFLALGWCLFFLTTMLWEFTHKVLWI